MKSRMKIEKMIGSKRAVTKHLYKCEALETRSLLAANDPVIVITEPFKFGVTSDVTTTTVAPWLWHN